MLNLFLLGTESEVIAANAKIGANAGYPCEGTLEWDIPTQAYEQEFWFIAVPQPYAIYNGHTGEELMEGVSNLRQEESQENWWPHVDIY
jgi:hypothetical protein